MNLVSVNRVLWVTICLALIISLVLLVILLIMISRRIRLENTRKKEKEKLEQSYTQLEERYRELLTSQTEFNKKYEELRQSEERNKKLAYCDSLTGIPNRTAFTEQLNHVMATLRQEENVGIMYIDLDRFKTINDSLGHSYGDELLIDVADRLSQTVDHNDYLARFGGDEFVILTQNIQDIGEYEEKVKKVQKVFSYPFVLAMKEFFITTSIGITFSPKDGKTTQALMKNVDVAMYAAKEKGKNFYCFYEETMNQNLLEQIQLQSELKKALENKEFELYYQAQIDLHTETVVGFEALIRWHHPERGLLKPEEFLSVAEKTGLIIPIGNWVLRQACIQLKEWQQIGNHNLVMAVNLSTRQFIDEKLIEVLKEIIKETDINPSQLEMEITEETLLNNIDYAIKLTELLKEMGIQISLDNFGTGYSFMNYLKVIPIDHLKIDQSFLNSLEEDKKEREIVSAIIRMAQVLKLTVVAEGVERSSQESFLKKNYCDRAQGFYYSEPITKENAIELIGMTNNYK